MLVRDRKKQQERCPLMSDVGQRGKALCSLDNLLYGSCAFRSRYHPRILGHSVEVGVDWNNMLPAGLKNKRIPFFCSLISSAWVDSLKVGVDDVSRLGREGTVSVAAKGLLPGLTTGFVYSKDSYSFASSYQSPCFSAHVSVDDSPSGISLWTSSMLQKAFNPCADCRLVTSAGLGCSTWRKDDKICLKEAALAMSLTMLHADKSTSEAALKIDSQLKCAEASLLHYFGPAKGLTLGLRTRRTSDGVKGAQWNTEFAVEQHFTEKSTVKCVFTDKFKAVVCYMYQFSSFTTLVLALRVGEKSTASVSVEMSD